MTTAESWRAEMPSALDRDLITHAQTMVYYTDDAPSVVGLFQPPKVITDADQMAIYAGTLRDGAVAVEFVYEYGDNDHLHRDRGLEVTVYATDGSVIASQDYG
jgi:hypothetical protein